MAGRAGRSRLAGSSLAFSGFRRSPQGPARSSGYELSRVLARAALWSVLRELLRSGLVAVLCSSRRPASAGLRAAGCSGAGGGPDRERRVLTASETSIPPLGTHRPGCTRGAGSIGPKRGRLGVARWPWADDGGSHVGRGGRGSSPARAKDGQEAERGPRPERRGRPLEPSAPASRRLSSRPCRPACRGGGSTSPQHALRVSAQQDRQIERTERTEDRKGRDRRRGSLCVFVGHGPAPWIQAERRGRPSGRGYKRTRRCRRTVRSVRGQRETCKRRCRVGPGGGDPPPYCLPEGIRLRRRWGQGAAHASSIDVRENMSRVHSGRRLRQMVDGPALRRGRAIS